MKYNKKVKTKRTKVFFVVMLIIIFVGVYFLVGCKNSEQNGNRTLPVQTTQTGNKIPSVQSAEYDGWLISLNSEKWSGGKLTVNVTIKNLGDRRYFAQIGGFDAYSLAAIDSTSKVIYSNSEVDLASWMECVNGFIKCPTMSFYINKDIYPNESISGKLEYNMSAYSGKTYIYIVPYMMEGLDAINAYGTRLFDIHGKRLFDVGSPG